MEPAVFPLNDMVSVRRAQPKNVLMTADTGGSVWTYALELARALDRHHIDVTLATMGTPLTVEQRLQVESLHNVQVYPSTFKMEWMQDPWKQVDLAGAWLLELEEATQPDVIHLNDFSHAALAWHTPTLVVGHSCVLSWWLAVRGEPAPGMWNTYRRRVTRGLSSARMVVAPSKAMAATLNQHYGPLDVRVIPNGRNPELFTPGNKEPYILAVGRLWDEAKNLTALEHIASDLVWPVYVAGSMEHPERGTIETDAVCPLGILPEDELASWMGHAAIYVLPARYEPFGLSVLEAGLSGCALVLGDIPSLREIWEGAAVFVPPNDPDALQRAIEDLIEDSDRREAIGSCARARSLRYTPQRMASRYVTAYSELMAANSLIAKN